jgi:hypothetical protein
MASTRAIQPLARRKTVAVGRPDVSHCVRAALIAGKVASLGRRLRLGPRRVAARQAEQPPIRAQDRHPAARTDAQAGAHVGQVAQPDVEGGDVPETRGAVGPARRRRDAGLLGAEELIGLGPERGVVARQCQSALEPRPFARVVVAVAPLLGGLPGLGVELPELTAGMPGHVGEAAVPALAGLEEEDLPAVLAGEQYRGDLGARADEGDDHLHVLLRVLDGEESPRSPLTRGVGDMLGRVHESLHPLDRLGGR